MLRKSGDMDKQCECPTLGHYQREIACDGEGCSRVICELCCHDYGGEEYCEDCCPFCQTALEYGPEMEVVF